MRIWPLIALGVVRGIVVEQHVLEWLQQVADPKPCGEVLMAPQECLLILRSCNLHVNQRIVVVPADWAVEIPANTELAVSTVPVHC